MQEANDNMDELFRRAAENYPLDTSSKDWNKVVLALQNEQEVVPPVKKENRGRFLWLLLLLPLGLICNQFALPGDERKLASTNTESEAVKSVQPEKNQDDKNSTISNDTATGINRKSSTSDLQKGNAQNQEKEQLEVDKNSAPDKFSSHNKPVNARSIKNSKNTSRNLFHSKTSPSKNNNQDRISDRTILSKPNQQRLNSGIDDENNDLFTKKIGERPPYLLTVPVLDPSNKNIVEEKLKPKTETKKEKKFYVGLMGGMDVTTIRFQKIEDAGYSYGLLLGYQLSKKWSVEAGVYKQKKFYYTDGEYFNTSNLWMPSNSKITEVSGNCSMIEIPLTARYTISSSQKRSWFVSAGGTSYIMQKEDYDYTYYYGNSGTYATHNRKYDSDSKQFFAAVHFSGGYTRKLNKTTDLRIEPYFKIPVAGMGVGELKFISTGLHLGITRKLF